MRYSSLKNTFRLLNFRRKDKSLFISVIEHGILGPSDRLQYANLDTAAKCGESQTSDHRRSSGCLDVEHDPFGLTA